MNHLPYAIDFSEKPGLLARPVERVAGPGDCSLNSGVTHRSCETAFVINVDIGDIQLQIWDRRLFRFDMIDDKLFKPGILAARLKVSRTVEIKKVLSERCG